MSLKIPYKVILVTGGAGFIGSNLVYRWLTRNPSLMIVVVDNLTYAGNMASLQRIEDNPALASRLRFIHADICDTVPLAHIFATYMPEAVIHLAAESHVDRSIDMPNQFLQTNVMGTATLLNVAKTYWHYNMPLNTKSNFRFLQVSTDEVYGSMPPSYWAKEFDPFNPTSPYAASKAAADHLAMSYYKTYGLPVLITHATNNFGPYQHPEKFIPTCIIKAKNMQEIPLYGDGQQRRDWMHVDEHCDALTYVLRRGEPGQRYNVGKGRERTNLELVGFICSYLDNLDGNANNRCNLFKCVNDRPGHDRRYAVNYDKLVGLGWYDDGAYPFSDTIDWYLNNEAWVQEVLQHGNYHMERQGLGK